MPIPDQLAALRTRFGSQITYKTLTVAASVTSIGSDNPDYIPAGPGSNAAFVDERIFTVNPTDFTTKPLAGETIVWDGENHVILGVRTLEFQGSPVSWRIITYKSMSLGSTQNAAQLAKWQLPL